MKGRRRTSTQAKATPGRRGDDGIAETGSYEMPCDDWDNAYRITRAPGTARPYHAARRGDPAVVLAAASLSALRELIRTGYLARPVPREIAP